MYATIRPASPPHRGKVYQNRHVIRRDLKAKREVGIDGQMCVGFDPAAFQGEI